MLLKLLLLLLIEIIIFQIEYIFYYNIPIIQNTADPPPAIKNNGTDKKPTPQYNWAGLKALPIINIFIHKGLTVITIHTIIMLKIIPNSVKPSLLFK